MNLKMIVGILVISALPVCAQAQKPSAAKVTNADAQKVVKMISGDKAKTQTYCDLVKLGDQFEEIDQTDTKKADELKSANGRTGGKAGSRIYRVSRRASGYGPGFQGQQGDRFDARRARQVVCEVGTGFAAPMRGVSLAREKVGRPIRRPKQFWSELSAQVGDALLGIRLSRGHWPRRQLKHRCRLPLAQQRQQHGPPV